MRQTSEACRSGCLRLDRHRARIIRGRNGFPIGINTYGAAAIHAGNIEYVFVNGIRPGKDITQRCFGSCVAGTICFTVLHIRNMDRIRSGNMQRIPVFSCQVCKPGSSGCPYAQAAVGISLLYGLRLTVFRAIQQIFPVKGDQGIVIHLVSIFIE